MTTTAARTRGPRRDAAENREALILAAATLLNRDPSASLEAIAAEAGLSRRAIYGHFATRDDLLRELALHGAERVNAAMLTRPLEGGGHGPAGHLATLGARLWNEVDHVRTVALITLRGPQQQVIVTALEPLRARVREIVAAGSSGGAFRDDIDVDRLARLVESAAISVLDEGVRHELSRDEGRRLVVLSVLAIAGLSHGDAADVFSQLPPLPDSPTADQEASR